MFVHIIFINDVVKTALKGRMSEEENKWVFNKYLMDSIGTMIAIVICDRQTVCALFPRKWKNGMLIGAISPEGAFTSVYHILCILGRKF